MPHGLSNDFYEALAKGSLHWLVERVKSDNTLDLEIREDELQIYYRGGRLMHVQRRGLRFPSSFDENYSANGRLPFAVPQDASDEAGWRQAIPLLKQEMDFYFSRHAGNEREFQQVLVRENNVGRLAGSTDYFICSMEYQNTDGRFDAVAVHWPSHGPSRGRTDNLPLTLIEIKYGDAAIGGPCGLTDHLDSFIAFAKEPHKLQRICEEMKNVFNQKFAFGLIEGATYPIESISPAQLHVLFVLANSDSQASALTNALEAVTGDLSPYFPGGVWISCASHFGAGLFHDQNMSIDDFRTELALQRDRCQVWNSRFKNRATATVPIRPS